MSSQLRVSRTLIALALGIGSLTGAALAQQAAPTGEGDAAAAAPAAAARSAARAAVSEEQQLQEKLRHMTSESAEGLKVVLRPDGSRMMDLEGQFMSVAIATPAKNGGYVMSCQTGEGALEHAKHARDVELGKAPKLLVRPTKQQPALEEK
ncbi:MAG TPA: hypothetical protein VFO35_10950 [Steroidobacteraceae bacterium]|nr:hypothetical protein [Steroidobacteraceae bacterium]